jgi:hypothetical protein
MCAFEVLFRLGASFSSDREARKGNGRNTLLPFSAGVMKSQRFTCSHSRLRGVFLRTEISTHFRFGVLTSIRALCFILFEVSQALDRAVYR